jgi:hypothetical protein
MKHCAVVCIALLLCLSAASAQTGSASVFAGAPAGGIHLRTIADAPFSADMVKQSTQVLPNGSVVPAVTQGKMFRDSKGRTRFESELASSTLTRLRRFVLIVDPVQRVNIVLDMQAKLATVSPLPVPSSPDQPAEDAADRDRPQARLSPVGVEARALTVRGAEDLGTSIIEGFQVTGSRRTTPPETAQDGEQMPRAVVESWFSPELKIELQARTAGPRLGETITTLQNIVAAEPDRALFEVPADYTVKTLPQLGKNNMSLILEY